MWAFIKQLLFIDQKTKLISHTKMWSNAGYAAMTYCFVYAVIVLEVTDPIFFIAFGGIVIGAKAFKEYHNRTKE